MARLQRSQQRLIDGADHKQPAGSACADETSSPPAPPPRPCRCHRRHAPRPGPVPASARRAPQDQPTAPRCRAPTADPCPTRPTRTPRTRAAGETLGRSLRASATPHTHPAPTPLVAPARSPRTPPPSFPSPFHPPPRTAPARGKATQRPAAASVAARHPNKPSNPGSRTSGPGSRQPIHSSAAPACTRACATYAATATGTARPCTAASGNEPLSDPSQSATLTSPARLTATPSLTPDGAVSGRHASKQRRPQPLLNHPPTLAATHPGRCPPSQLRRIRHHAVMTAHQPRQHIRHPRVDPERERESLANN